MTAERESEVEIRVEGLYKSFDEHAVLRGIDLTILTGDFVAVVGGSGCGKTVLLNHLLGLMQPDTGRVLVSAPDLHGRGFEMVRRSDGDRKPLPDRHHRPRLISLGFGRDDRKHVAEDAPVSPGLPMVDMAGLSTDELDEIHTHWGVVFQRNALFSGSVLDNIGLWLEEVRHLGDAAIDTIAAEVLSAVGLPHHQDFLDSRVDSLSGGMAKRIAIARALAMAPRCMFFDEPTTGLDPVTAAQIQDLLLASHGEGASMRTTVIITHDKDLLSRLRPRVVMLHEGRVSFDGPFEDFEASDSPIIRPYFELMPILHQRGGI